MEFKFKNEHNIEERKKQCNILLIRNPNKVPIVLEKAPNCEIEGIKKTKFLIQKDFTVNQFSRMVRALISLPEGGALFFTAKGKYTISGQRTMGQIYKEFKDKEDKFLYIAYSTELVYG